MVLGVEVFQRKSAGALALPVKYIGTGTPGLSTASPSVSKSAIVVVLLGGGVGSSRTWRLTFTLVIASGAGVKTRLLATGKQHASSGFPGVGVFR
jgi:hypothetical protein